MGQHEDFVGFVEATVYTAQHRIDGLIFKAIGKRLLEQLDTDRRELIPVAQAKVYAIGGDRPLFEVDTIAIAKRAILGVVPRDGIKPDPQFMVWDFEQNQPRPLSAS